MIVITIDGQNRTSSIDQRSVRYKNKLSKAPATLDFAIKGDTDIPDTGDSILLQQDGDNFFKGTITRRSEKILNGIKVGYNFFCMDGYYELDRRLVVKAYNNTTVGAVVTDIINTYTTGFTLDIPDDTPAIKTVRFNYEQPSRCLEKLMNAVGWDWSISPTDVVSVFIPGDNPAPYEVNDESGDIVSNSLKFDSNILELSNVVYVRGGEYDDPISEADAIDKYEANGIDQTFPLVYRYSQTQVTVNGVAQSVGRDFLDEAVDFDLLYNFQEKLVRFPDGALSSGDIVRVFGNGKVPLIVLGEDIASIDAYGAREFVEINKNITSISEGELFADSLLEQKRAGKKEADFDSYKTGWKVGQTATVNSAKFGKVNDVYKINSVSAKMHDHESFIFSVDLIKSSETTFTDIMLGLIGKEKDNVTIASNEVLQRFRKVTDQLGLSDEIIQRISTTGPYGYAPVTTRPLGKYNFSTYS